MSSITDAEVHSAVYGEVFESSKATMQMLEATILARKDVGFASAEECAQWAHENLLDRLAYSKTQHKLLNMTFRGELTSPEMYRQYFSDILFWWQNVKNDRQEPVQWKPTGFEYGESARLIAEKGDGMRKPLYHRDYFIPTGAYDKVTQTFNVAKPFPAFAKETGRDTSHIWTYLKNISGGECYDHLCEWLRFKCMFPKSKTEVIPVIVSRTQGNGKTTFANVICSGLFGEDNVIVTDQYDANSRFNADYADALVICAEEKEDNDKRSTAASLKSRSTGKMIRKENKGLDPIYQENYGEFVITTNKEVPIRFEGEEKQRRFMVMGSNPDFVREKSDLADQIFTKLYGEDAAHHVLGTPFAKDIPLIQQMKHELVERTHFNKVPLHEFPITEEYKKCISEPQTTEATEIASIIRSLSPFIRESLLKHQLVRQVTVTNYDGSEDILDLQSYAPNASGVQFMPSIGGAAPYIALCKPIIFFDQNTGKPFNHAIVERTLSECNIWLLANYKLQVLPNQSPIPGGFMRVNNRHRQAPAARIVLVEVASTPEKPPKIITAPPVKKEPRIGACLRVNTQWQPDSTGEFETVNEMKPGVDTLKDKNNNVQYMDTFLFEADDTDKQTYIYEQSRLNMKKINPATELFRERLATQRRESDRLLNEGTAFRVVYSGGKSYHILVRVSDAPNTLDEYKWLHAHLCTVLSTILDFDTSCNDPARLTRAPVERVREFTYLGAKVMGTQQLYREEPGNIFYYTWRPLYQQWLDRPPDVYEQNGRKLRPTKPEYHEAMRALLTGTFWTENIWRGRRQRCFFPAYRLCRLLGYTHEQLWTPEGLFDGLERYYRKGEINYWKTREHCSLIEEIDKDCDRQLEEDMKHAVSD
jgi:hypothetical protein